MTGVTPGALLIASKWTSPIRPIPITPTLIVGLVSDSSTFMDNDDFDVERRAVRRAKTFRLEGVENAFVEAATKAIVRREVEINLVIFALVSFSKSRIQTSCVRWFLLDDGQFSGRMSAYE